MSKRKAAVNDIIFELDNDDIVISSDDEGKDQKNMRLKKEILPGPGQEKLVCKETLIKKKYLDCPEGETSKSRESQKLSKSISTKTDKICKIVHSVSEVNDIQKSKKPKNRGKAKDVTKFSCDRITSVDSTNEANNYREGSNNTYPSMIISHEDILIDSPLSNTNSDPGVVGCENKTPLVTVRFKDRNIARRYKNKVKSFLLNLIKIHDQECLIDNETDLEFDIWPEDLEEEEKITKHEENLFFIDLAPSSKMSDDIPRYREVPTMISNAPREPSPPAAGLKRVQTCFNCEGSHPLRDCTQPRNNLRITENRKKIGVKLGRYHVEDEQKYGHLIPGRISGRLRHALGLKRHELPLHIYRMRLLGYPPGWLEEAKISHSGITMFDSAGCAILDPEEEEGEVCEPGSKDKFDIKKILDFPGFNVPPSSRYIEKSPTNGMPPMSEMDSKLAMLQMLAPNAMKAYKRKKLTLFPSASTEKIMTEHAEMELDSGDEVVAFPSVPPLPDEAPPALPPPPDSPPPELVDSQIVDKDKIHMEDSGSEIIKRGCIVSRSSQSTDCLTSPFVDHPNSQTLSDSLFPCTNSSSNSTDKPCTQLSEEHSAQNDNSQSSVISSDVEVITVTKVMDIPTPPTELITIDDDDDSKQNLQTSTGRESPSLEDLEKEKLVLLNALGNEVSIDSDKISLTGTDKSDVKVNTENISSDQQNIALVIRSDGTQSEEVVSNICSKEEMGEESDMISKETITHPITAKEIQKIEATKNITGIQTENKTASPKVTGLVKGTLFGTPVINAASSYLKLPSDENFAKDICDVIYFENLPNSTGKFKKISNLLKKVKSEVDRIQDS